MVQSLTMLQVLLIGLISKQTQWLQAQPKYERGVMNYLRRLTAWLWLTA
jgi:hypothetical protein